MDDKTAEVIEKVVPLALAIVCLTFLSIFEIKQGQNYVANVLVGLIGILAGIKIPGDSIPSINNVIGLKKVK